MMRRRMKRRRMRSMIMVMLMMTCMVHPVNVAWMSDAELVIMVTAITCPIWPPRFCFSEWSWSWPAWMWWPQPQASWTTKVHLLASKTMVIGAAVTTMAMKTVTVTALLVTMATAIAMIMQWQNDITEMLIKEQRHFVLPSHEILVFKRDPLHYLTFIRTFEFATEDKTRSRRERLFFLEQFTEGQPQSLVPSCLHMPSQRGCWEARRLLHEHYGNDLLISSAYLDKAFSRTVIKAEDRKALNN